MKERIARFLGRLRGDGVTSRVSRAVPLAPSRDAVPRHPAERAQRFWHLFPHRAMPYAVLAAVALSGWIFQQFLYTSSYFDLRDVQVFGAERLTPLEVERLLIGDSTETIHLLSYDAKSAARRLEGHPGIRRAEVRKVFPNHIDILIQERAPAAILVGNSTVSLVDVEGVVFARASSAEILSDRWPILSGPDGRGFDLGESLPDQFRDQAFLYSETLARIDGPLADEVSEINWTPASGITVILRGGTRLLCGDLPPSRTLPRAEALSRKLGDLKGVDYAELRVDSHLPWKGYAPPEPDPKKSKTRQTAAR